MAEEIVDLAGSRIEDPRYVDNVIFDKEGLNELLTHIKNYPIIDIDYVEEHDKDALNTDKEVWPTYTEGTPCIKVTYGDSNSANGNLSAAKRKEIRELQEVYRLLSGVQNIINKYNTIEDEYISLITNIEEELNKILYNVSVKYHNLLNANYENTEDGLICWDFDEQHVTPTQHFIDATTQEPIEEWGGSLYNMLDPNKYEYQLYHKGPNTKTKRIADGLNYKIKYKIESFKGQIETWIKNTNSITEGSFYSTTYLTRSNKEKINPLFENGATEFYFIPWLPKLPAIDGVDQNFDKNSFKTNATSTNINVFLTMFDGGSTIEEQQKNAQLRDSFRHYNDLLLNLEEILSTGGEDNQGNIKTLLLKYIGYLQEARWKRYEEIRQYLVANNINIVELQDTTQIDLRTAIIDTYSTDSSSNYYQVSTYVNENYIGQDKQTILDQIQDIIDNSIENKYTEASSYVEGTEYYVFNANTQRYERVTISSFENGVKYYTLNNNNFPAVYGYKYVKVGSNITWDQNYDYDASTIEKTGNSATQASGTFRITINGHTYEIPIKGFGSTASNQPITMNTTDDDGIIIRAKDNNNTLNPIVLDGNVTITGTTTAEGNVTITGTTTAEGDVTLGTETGASNLLPSLTNTGNIGNEEFIPAAGTTYNSNITYYVLNSTTGEYKEAVTQPSSQSDINRNNPKYFIKKTQAWNTIYVNQVGSPTTPVENGYFNSIHIGGITIGGSSSGSGGPSSTFLGQSGWTNKLTGPLYFGNVSNNTFSANVTIKNTTADGIKQGDSDTATNGFNATYTGTYYGDTTASIYTKGGIYAAKNIWATRVFNAVFNDYAECRTTIDLTPGHVVVDQDDGSLVCSSKRLQPGAQVISDTYGHLMGATDKATTPIAVAGRVLVYTYQPRENYHAGMAVCSAPDGTVDIMSRAEICEYPDCIVGIVSEIPDCEIWGSDNVKVDGRIWIKVR